MGALIDTSVIVAAEREEFDFEQLLGGHEDEEIALAAITASELLHGVHRMTGGVRRARVELWLERLLARLPVVPFDLDVARVHAILSAELRTKGTPVGPHDLIIAATAVFLGYSVATRDLRSFPRIRGLTVLRW